MRRLPNVHLSDMPMGQVLSLASFGTIAILLSMFFLL